MSLDQVINLIGNIAGPLAVGFVIWLLGEQAIDKRNKNDAIRDLMSYRGDYGSPDFRRSLNKISITFHKNKEIRAEIRGLYEMINNPTSQEGSIKRKIVGLIYDLCQQNGFEGISEYDIDQAFPESKQSPPEARQLEAASLNTEISLNKNKKAASRLKKK